MEKIKYLLKKYREQIVYIIFGALTTLVNFAVTILCTKCFGMSEGRFTLCNAIAWVCAVLFAFFVNKLFVFESKSFRPAVVLPEFGKFVGMRLITGLLEIFLPEPLMNLGLDFELFGQRGIIAKLIVSIIVIVLNYVFSKFWIFRKEKNGNADAAEEDSDSAGR